jgi:glycosyltransferase involved in cell wall biosynthesis
MQSILFVSHEASRTGAPASLLAVVRELAKAGMLCEVLILRDGPLTADFRAVCPTTVLWKAPPPVITTERLLLRLFLKLIQEAIGAIDRIGGRMKLARFIRSKMRDKIDAVYLNSAVSSSVIHQMQRFGCPIISHIHELSSGLQHSGHPANLAAMLRSSSRIIVPAPCVAQALSQTYGVPSDRLQVIPEAVADPLADNLQHPSMDLPDGAWVIAMAGTVDWRKGIDLFIALGRALRTSLPQAHFLWTGGGRGFPLFQKTWRSLYGIDDALAARLHFVGEQTTIAPFLNRADVFALTSREDPLPLVHIEAAMLRKPVVCFAASGGAPEWIGNAGAVVPYQDVAAMADAIMELANNPERCKRMGEAGRAMMLERCLPDVVAAQVRTVIEEVL